MALYNKPSVFLPSSLKLPNHTMPMSESRKTLQAWGIGEPGDLRVFTPTKRHELSNLFSSRMDSVFDLHLRLCVILVAQRPWMRRINRRGEPSQALRSYPPPGGYPVRALCVPLDRTWVQKRTFGPNDIMLYVCWEGGASLQSEVSPHRASFFTNSLELTA